ncbi:hypothetical protein [Simplicispira psychrophila]|uniref:hypothetical protein n=1 Tax=Simplicispira psychrophila TaxID=80882 RepID=UPI00047FA78D|nr:hypothetical protein [Simplicispira psychrophila]
MTEVSTRPQVGATKAPAPLKTAIMNHCPIPPMRCVEPAEPEPLTAFDFLDRIGEIGVHWWSMIDHILEMQSSSSGKDQPVPEWALKILRDQGRHTATNDEFRIQRDNMREVLRLAEGKTTFSFEVWGDRTTRLSLRHESVADAMPEREYWRANGHPNAFIMKIHRHNNCSTASGVAMLDTLLGKVWFAGVSFAQGDSDEHTFQIQDETGRVVELTASELRGHKILERITHKKNRASLDAWLQDEAQEGGQV